MIKTCDFPSVDYYEGSAKSFKRASTVKLAGFRMNYSYEVEVIYVIKFMCYLDKELDARDYRMYPHVTEKVHSLVPHVKEPRSYNVAYCSVDYIRNSVSKGKTHLTQLVLSSSKCNCLEDLYVEVYTRYSRIKVRNFKYEVFLRKIYKII